ncbi:uncharacterized protein LOC117487588 [Trematomus bernacchii]|uniref:uncharacterized protein LOC117487588 n=1 Tax=Trematomus bernacchii TaxID=40690 RepID=UPI00146F84E8|nr:uncharacterized protein LOC117487588 [Trematomus bernacchii]
MEKAQLQARFERMEMDASLAESDAKMKVLEHFETGSQNPTQDGMNDYVKDYRVKPHMSMDAEPSPITFAEFGAIPKTPLQRLLYQQPRPPENIDNTNQSPQHTARDAGITGTNNNDNFLTVMQRQNDIVNLLVLQQKQTSLPTREIPVFDGNPLNYQIFVRAFQHGIEEKTTSNQDRLYYLEQYTSGSCRELVRSCLHMDANSGFAEAKRLLKVHFGDELKIANAYMGKALNWNTIKAEDGKSLHCYALFLRGCCNAMRDLQDMEELDLPSNLRLILSKLPYKLREKWRTAACDILDRSHQRAKLHDLVVFIERQARPSLW